MLYFFAWVLCGYDACLYLSTAIEALMNESSRNTPRLKGSWMSGNKKIRDATARENEARIGKQAADYYNSKARTGDYYHAACGMNAVITFILSLVIYSIVADEPGMEAVQALFAMKPYEPFRLFSLTTLIALVACILAAFTSNITTGLYVTNPGKKLKIACGVLFVFKLLCAVCTCSIFLVAAVPMSQIILPGILCVWLLSYSGFLLFYFKSTRLQE